MLSMNLLQVDGIVICSGDGLVYEVLYFLVYPNNVLLDHFLNCPLYHQVAIMIIIFIASSQGQ